MFEIRVDFYIILYYVLHSIVMSMYNFKAWTVIKIQLVLEI